MRITVDTNILVRSAVRDDTRQADAANRVLRDASSIVVTLPCLCEFVWVLRSAYRLSVAEIEGAIQPLLDTANVILNRLAVEEGLAVLRAGGDFADGVIAYEGKWLGGETFVSFDKKAVALIVGRGDEARVPG